MADRERNRKIREINAYIPLLAEATEAHREWARDNCFVQEICLCKGRAWCTRCGKVFPLDKKDVIDGEYVCPCCGKSLKVRSTTKRKLHEWQFMTIVDMCRCYHVFRHFKVRRKGSVNYTVGYTLEEVAQNWVDKTGEIITSRKGWCTNGSYNYGFLWDSPLKVRASDYGYYRSGAIKSLYINAYHIYPDIRVSSLLRRNGFRGSFHDITPCQVASALLSSNYMEMLWKTKQYNLFDFLLNKNMNYYTYPEAVRIANRNHYFVKDASMWDDYLALLRYFDLDLHNAHYVCPKNLKKEHDILLERKRKREARLAKERRIAEAARYERKYAKHILPFKDLRITDGVVCIAVIPSVLEVSKEGEAMHHCVYDCGYYKHDDVLLLSARINGERVETIEVNLETSKVIQSRGLCNSKTEYHDRIVNLMEENMGKIQKLRQAI